MMQKDDGKDSEILLCRNNKELNYQTLQTEYFSQ